MNEFLMHKTIEEVMDQGAVDELDKLDRWYMSRVAIQCGIGHKPGEAKFILRQQIEAALNGGDIELSDLDVLVAEALRDQRRPRNRNVVVTEGWLGPVPQKRSSWKSIAVATEASYVHQIDLLKRLSKATVEELRTEAKGLGLTIQPSTGRDEIVDAIMATQGAPAAAVAA